MKQTLKKMWERLNSKAMISFNSTNLSGNLIEVEVSKDEIDSKLNNAWKDPQVPQRQFDMYTRNQLKDYRKGVPIEPFDILVDILRESISNTENTILEIGCSSGYYKEVLKIKGINMEYHGCDYSEAFITFAKKLFPGIDFQVQDARSLTYPDNCFNIVISGCCLLHILEYEKAIRETARVAKDYVIFHRTPVLHKKETSYYNKTAYGIKMFEIHFNERELIKLFKKNGLRIIDIITFNASLEETTKDFYAYKTYLCEKNK
mgnify:CR=1 FL=1